AVVTSINRITSLIVVFILSDKNHILKRNCCSPSPTYAAFSAYLFMRTKKKDTNLAEEDVDLSPPVSTTPVTAPPVTETPSPVSSITQPLKLPEPIPESQQRELFKYILEEKRKAKPKDPEEKKRLDEEKAILKQFIRAKSIPQL
ncbi:hypothetical protein Goari_002276, partial [Gossypium aridum]|nr:hypothetical protein [Gossypium aridum]